MPGTTSQVEHQHVSRALARSVWVGHFRWLHFESVSKSDTTSSFHSCYFVDRPFEQNDDPRFTRNDTKKSTGVILPLVAHTSAFSLTAQGPFALQDPYNAGPTEDRPKRGLVATLKGRHCSAHGPSRANRRLDAYLPAAHNSLPKRTDQYSLASSNQVPAARTPASLTRHAPLSMQRLFPGP